MLHWLAAAPVWQRALIGALVGGSVLVFIGEGLRWWLGKSFAFDYVEDARMPDGTCHIKEGMKKWHLCAVWHDDIVEPSR